MKKRVSDLQEALWRLEQSQSGSTGWELLEAFEVQGALHIERLRESAGILLDRHESLRDAFLYEEVPGRRSGRLVRVELIADAALRFGESVDAERRIAFDAAAGALFRVVLIERGSNEHVLVLRASRLVADETSMEVLIEELGELYGESRLPERGRSYSDFEEWRRRQPSQADAALGGALPVVQLPVDRSRAQVRDSAAADLRFTVPAATARRAEALAGQLEISVDSVFRAAFMALLRRYTGEEDVLVGSVRDLRRGGGFEGLVGCCSDTVLLRADLSGHPTFEEAVRRVHASRPTVADGAAQYQVRFDWRERPPAELRLAGLDVTPLASQTDCELVLRMWPEGDGYAGGIRYRQALFEACTVSDLARHYLTLLAAGTERPEQPVPDIPILDSAERQRILVDWNATGAEYPRDLAVHQLFERQVERSPEAVALSSRGTNLTYRKLNDRANQLARQLEKLGAGPGALVGISLPRSPEMLVAVLGVLKTGGAYIPLDPVYPNERLAHMIEDSGMGLIVKEDGIEAVAGRSDTGSGRDLAYVLYTSGSTGKPKGVQIPHRAVVNFLCSMAREPGLSADDVLLAVTTLSFDIAGLELFLPLSVGARIVLAGSDEVADGARLRELLETSGITAMQATPATWRLLIEAGWKGDPRLKVLCGGEALDRPLADQLLKRCGSLWNMYGPTETTIWSTLWTVEAGDGPILIGHPIANTQVYVLDGQRQPVPAGVAGELYIGGDGLMRGYWNRPDLTEQALVEVAGASLYQTGDLVRFRRDGNLEFIGRIDQQVKWHGFRIELGEIESALARHQDIAAAAAMVREDMPGRKQLVAYFVPRVAPGPALSELRRHLAGLLPPYMIPSIFVGLESLPRTPNGKTNRRALPAPDRETRQSEETYATPRTDTEKRLAAIWQQVLGVRRIGVRDNYFDLGAESLVTAQVFLEIERKFHRRISPTALFQAPTIEQLSRVLEAGDQRSAWSCLVPVVAQGSKPPLFCIHGGAGTILFFYDLARYLDDERPVYALQAQGLYGGAPPHATIEEMARHYLREIRAVQEHGPYHLIGYCFGVIVAYEMAQMLRADGEKVAVLASLNGPCPRYRNAPPGDPGAERAGVAGLLLRSARKVRAYLRSLRRKVQRRRVAYYRRKNRPLPLGLRDRFFEFNNARAERCYEARPYPGSMVIFRAKGLYRDPLLGWADLVQGGFTVHEIPGRHVHHRTLMEEPAVKVLADELRAELGKLK